MATAGPLSPHIGEPLHQYALADLIPRFIFRPAAAVYSSEVFVCVLPRESLILVRANSRKGFQGSRARE